MTTITGRQHGPDEDDLAKRVRTDRQAFAALYDLYYEKILRYCSRRLFSQAAGEDLTSDVFLKAAKQIDSFRGASGGEFSQWLYTIATNRVNEYLRTNKRREELLQTAVQQKRVGSRETHDKTEHLDWPAVQEAILQMNSRDQTLITLRYMQEMPHEQIAGIVDLKPATVRVAISRAIDKLRKHFNNDPVSGPKGVSQ